MNRPGVATTISTPARSSVRCSPMCVPPTTMVLLILDVRLNAFTSCSICCASSRVGARTTARGPSPLRMGGWLRQC
eukprot:scaffold68_cov340-Pavlova_lutheri.AAC.11